MNDKKMYWWGLVKHYVVIVGLLLLSYVSPCAQTIKYQIIEAYVNTMAVK